MAPTLPQIELDTTLAELYGLDGGDAREIVLVIAVPPPGGPVAASLPPNTKFPYQSPNYPKLGDDIYARVCLGAAPQHHGFVAGPMPVHLFDLDKSTYESVTALAFNSVPSHRLDAERVYSQLAPKHRPRLGFISNPANFKTAPGEKIVTYTPLDCFEPHETVVDQAVHYELLSKRSLAAAGLPTPPTEVLECHLAVADVEDPWLVDEEAKRLVAAVRDRALPFVLKFPQSLAGQGVFVLRDEQDRARCLEGLENEVLSMIRTLTEESARLRPVSLILQDLLPGTAVAHSFFVTKTGRAVFTGCCEQVIDTRGNWNGAVIDYQRQEELQTLYGPTMDQIAAYVHSRGFYGPLGADIMLNDSGHQFVIDLNVRLTGSYVLGLLRGHFSARRGLHYASLLTPVAFRGDRDQFEGQFAAELTEGSIVIAGWCGGRGGPGGIFRYSIGSVVVGGRDQADLFALIERVNSISIKR